MKILRYPQRLALKMTEAEASTSTVGVIGNVAEFQLGKDDFEAWLERLELFIVINNIQHKKEVFLTLVGSKTYEVLRALCTPKKPVELDYDVLTKKVLEYVKPTPSIQAQRSAFRARVQKDETVTEFIAQLQALSRSCEFTNLEEELRDQITHGIANMTLKKKLYEEPKSTFTYTRVCEICAAWEGTQTSMNMAKNFTHTVNQQVNKITAQQKKKYEKNVTAKPSGYVKAPSPKSADTKDYKTPLEKEKKCSCCGYTTHVFRSCKYKEYTCNICKKKGHLAQVCFKKINTQKESKEKETPATNFIANKESNGIFVDTLCNYNINVKKSNMIMEPIWLKVIVDGIELNMELDTGAAISAISEQCYRKYFSSKKLYSVSHVQQSYDGSVLDCLGVMIVDVTYRSMLQKNLELYVMKGNAPGLFGREWFLPFGINVSLNQINVMNSSNVTDKFPEVFAEKLGTYNVKEFSLFLKDNVVPKFFRPRPLPFSLKEKVGQELDRMVKLGVLKPVETSEWGTPIVPIVKSNGEIRICGDFKVTVNPFLKIDRYPLPRAEDIFVGISGCKYYSKIDLSHAYQQLRLTSESRKVLTLSTHLGLFEPSRLMFGIASAPGIFQREMEKICQGLEFVSCYLDDILIGGKTLEHHTEILNAVLERLKKVGLTVNKEKCEFFKTELLFLGFKVTKDGIFTDKNKVKVINEMPKPTNVDELKAFIGVISYFNKFIPNAASMLKPLYELLEKNKKWYWTAACDSAFDKVKKVLLESKFLIHFDANKALKIKSDASPYGVGGVLCHVLESGEEQPIAFASRTLNKAERNYAQIDKEALAIVFCLQKFFKYVYGLHFILETDHKPLTYIFSKKKECPQVVVNRLHRYALFLADFDFEIKYIPSKKNVLADGLSRLPLVTNVIDAEPEICYINFVNDIFAKVDMDKLKAETLSDETLKEVVHFVKNGWPEVKGKNIAMELKPYFFKRMDLTLERGCLFVGTKLVVPRSVQHVFLKELHATHLGVVKMKGLARNHFWWPGLDKQIETLTNNCIICLEKRHEPSKVKLHKWTYPNAAGERVHADFCKLMDRNFLIVTDQYSKWLEIYEMRNNTTAVNTIMKFKDYFSRWGLINTLVTDNGPPFSSLEFRTFLNKNGINHKLTPPFHPQSNGAAENCVGMFKDKIKKAVSAGVDLFDAIFKFLLDYRTSIHVTTNRTPSDLHLGRKIYNKFDVIRRAREKSQEENFKGKRDQMLEVGDLVMARDYRNDREKWIEGEIVNKEGNVTFEVQTEEGALWRRHADQLIEKKESIEEKVIEESVLERAVDLLTKSPVNQTPPTPQRGVTRSGRVIKPPERLNL